MANFLNSFILFWGSTKSLFIYQLYKTKVEIILNNRAYAQ